MSPSLSSARLKLSYPLYSADFDPLNPYRLIVGGGGGYASTGIPNKITLIDACRRNELSEIVDVELPKNGDSVSSIAVAQSDETSLTAFAGINSSLADQKSGKNEHFRSFSIGMPPKRPISGGAEGKPDVEGKTKPLASISLFGQPAGDKNEAYQRLTRVSRPKAGQTPSVFAVASALATANNEVVVLKNVPKPQTSDVLARISLGRSEAADVDFVSYSDTGAQTMAYCTDDRVFLQEISSTADHAKAPVEVYETSQSMAKVPVAERPKLRAIRYLTPRHILLLQNQPKKMGAELLILRVNEDGTQGSVRLQKRLSKSMKSAVGLDVCLLSESPIGEKQIIVAIAGQDSSVEMMTLEFSEANGMSTFRPFSVLQEVHSGPITKICFSTFIPPTAPLEEKGSQCVKLASVGVDKTVVIHTFPLRPFSATHGTTPRYVLAASGKSETLQTGFSIFMAIFVIGIVAFFLQAFTEIRGAAPPTLGATNWLSPRMREMVARPYIFAEESIVPSVLPTVSAVAEQVKDAYQDLPTVAQATEKLQHLVQQQAEQVVPQAIVMRDKGGELATELHHEADAVKAETVKKWEDLTEPEKKGWKKRLSDAGHWSAGQGESVLKGVFFSELAGLVGEIVGGS